MPEQRHGRIVGTATEVRAGTRDKPQRNVLIVSTLGVIAAFALIWLYYFS